MMVNEITNWKSLNDRFPINRIDRLLIYPKNKKGISLIIIYDKIIGPFNPNTTAATYGFHIKQLK
jgi:hypothetical protein